MDINGNVHCFFEQSGVFKNEFKKLGINAFDYDIENNFGQTDCVIDLFKEIEKAYIGEKSIFDKINENDLIIAFFPCIYFCCNSQMLFSLSHKNLRKFSDKKKIEYIIVRNRKRYLYFHILLEFIGVCLEKNIRMVFENPCSEQTHLKEAFVKRPDVIDNNRMLRGDYFVKPTAYWFFNCKPTFGFSKQYDKEKQSLMMKPKNKVPGNCSIERSTISPDYARNFICDFLIGKKQDFGQTNLF